MVRRSEEMGKCAMKEGLKMTITYLGPEGSFSEQAARCAARLYQGEAVFVAMQTLEEAIAAVTQKHATHAVVPIENSIEGAINATLDTLIFDADLTLCAQVDLPVVQNLLMHPEVGEAVPARIYSHPQGLAQSRKFLHKQYPQAALLPAPSTSEAARMVAEAGNGAEGVIAAVASVLAAERYGLVVRHAGIQENRSNTTQFAVVSAVPSAIYRHGEKTSLAFSTSNEPGALYKILDIFALWNLNMTRIVSRPMKDTPGAYVFFIDIENPENPDDMRDALTMVRRKTSFFKLLGSYPVWQGK